MLVKARADIEAKDLEGRTAAMAAACRGQMDCLSFLLENGADIEAKDLNGRTAAMHGAEKGMGIAFK